MRTVISHRETLHVSSALRLVPLGGLGEIGMNCMALESGDDIVVVDCGVMFPDRELGVDVIHPDFTWLEERADRVRAILVTHGHEDHIGAIPYLLRRVDAPIYGPPYALRLVRNRLREHDLPRAPKLEPVRPRMRFRVGCFDVEPIRVTHSIADATALVIRTPAGVVVHTGDFKIEHEPTDGEHFDASRLREVGDEGVRLLLSDSTNAWVEGSAGEEKDVAAGLDRIVGQAKGRVVVSIFASNVHRLRALFETARRHGRRVCLLGRSVRMHTEVATEIGYLRDPGAVLVPDDRAASLPPEKLLVIATGTQGEKPAALARLARDRHPALSLGPGDEVVLSARIIPGNEQSVYGMINQLERLGATVRFWGTDPDIHVSGHAHAGEQRRMLELVRPDAFMPVHGTLMHLKRHAALAQATGVRETLVVENGAVVHLDDEGLRVVGEAPVGRVHVDAGEEIPDRVLRDRALLAELGIAIAVVAVDREGRLLGAPDVVTRGVVHEEEEAELLEGARQYLGDELSQLRTPRLQVEDTELEDLARRALKRYFGRRLGRKPLTYAVVVGR